MAILVWNGVGVSRKLRVGVYEGIYRFNSKCIRISREIRDFDSTTQHQQTKRNGK